MICPRGLKTAQKYFHTFPHQEGLRTARRVCDGEIPDWTGLTQKDISYLRVEMPEVSGFTRWHAEQWVDLCTGKPCDLKPKHIKNMNTFDLVHTGCRPTYRLDSRTPRTIKELEDDEISQICSGMRTKKKTLLKLKADLEEDGIYPFAQLLLDKRAIGFVDTEKNVYLSLPSEPLDDFHSVNLSDTAK